MKKRRILITEYCEVCAIDPAFVDSLAHEDLIRVAVESGERFIDEEQLEELDQFVRWHYDLDINLAGIEAMRHLIDRVKKLQQEMMQLRDRLNRYEG